MSDGTYRLLNVDSRGVPLGSHNDHDGYTQFDYEPSTVPLVPAGPKPSGFDPPISFIDNYTPGPSSPVETIDCQIIAANWTYDEQGEYSNYSISLVSGGVVLNDSILLSPGDVTPLILVDKDD